MLILYILFPYNMIECICDPGVPGEKVIRENVTSPACPRLRPCARACANPGVRCLYTSEPKTRDAFIPVHVNMEMPADCGSSCKASSTCKRGHTTCLDALDAFEGISHARVRAYIRTYFYRVPVIYNLSSERENHHDP